jgi:malonyl-CoA decarboxylase
MAKLAAPGWHTDMGAVAELKPELLPLCASYLLHAKQGGKPADSVARFHLANGAQLQRVNWLSDVSRRGLDHSFGLTANYVYHPASLPQNCEAYGTSASVKTTRHLERLSQCVDPFVMQTILGDFD